MDAQEPFLLQEGEGVWSCNNLYTTSGDGHVWEHSEGYGGGNFEDDLVQDSAHHRPVGGLEHFENLETFAKVVDNDDYEFNDYHEEEAMVVAPTDAAVAVLPNLANGYVAVTDTLDNYGEFSEYAAVGGEEDGNSDRQLQRHDSAFPIPPAISEVDASLDFAVASHALEATGCTPKEEKTVSRRTDHDSVTTTTTTTKEVPTKSWLGLDVQADVKLQSGISGRKKRSRVKDLYEEDTNIYTFHGTEHFLCCSRLFFFFPVLIHHQDSTKYNSSPNSLSLPASKTSLKSDTETSTQVKKEGILQGVMIYISTTLSNQQTELMMLGIYI